MILHAEVLAISQFKAFLPSDLDYEPARYENVEPEGLIINCVAKADSTSQSHVLAVICCMEPWDLGAHKIERIQRPSGWVSMDDRIGNETVIDVVARLSRLLEAGVDLWYRPNG